MARKKKADSIHQQVPDKQGNQLWIMESGNIFLKLLKERRRRRLGFIDRDKKTLFVRKKRASHLFKKSNSYGFNFILLSKAKTFNKINLSDEFGQYEFPIKKVLEHGKLHFEKQGFELQIFLPLEIITNCRVKDISI